MAMRFKRLSDCIVCSLVVCLSVVDLRIELSATRLSAVYGQPALDYHLIKSGTSGANAPEAEPETRSQSPAPKAGVLPSAPLPESLCQWTCREPDPEALSAGQSADPSASPSLVAKRLVWDSNPTWLA